MYLDGHTQLRQTELPWLQILKHLQEELRSNPERLPLCKPPQLLQHPAHRLLPAHHLGQSAQQSGQPGKKNDRNKPTGVSDPQNIMLTS